MSLTAHPPVPIPRALDARPKWKGRYPIPFVMFIDDQGVPDFRVNDEARRDESIAGRLCALCGDRLPPNWSAFVGGPLCEVYGLFMDGPMHEGCARYSFTICPYLAAPNAHHANTAAIQARHAGELVAVNDRIGSERPDRMGLFFARSWVLARIKGENGIYFAAPRFERVEWYA